MATKETTTSLSAVLFIKTQTLREPFPSAVEYDVCWRLPSKRHPTPSNCKDTISGRNQTYHSERAELSPWRADQRSSLPPSNNLCHSLPSQTIHPVHTPLPVLTQEMCINRDIWNQTRTILSCVHGNSPPCIPVDTVLGHARLLHFTLHMPAVHTSVCVCGGMYVCVYV